MDTGYTLIAYKPESCDYCRGCLMDSYSSDFRFYLNLDKAGLIKYLAEIEDLNETLGHHEFGYVYCILYNGVRLAGELYPDMSSYFEESEYYVNFILPKQKEVEEIIKNRNEIKAAKEKLKEEQRAAAAKAAEKEKRDREEFKKQQELNELERLKKKYENQ